VDQEKDPQKRRKIGHAEGDKTEDTAS